MLPFLRLSSGQNYSGTALNRDLKRILGNVADDMGGSVSFYSIRSGIATSIAASGKGGQEIMSIGR